MECEEEQYRKEEIKEKFKKKLLLKLVSRGLARESTIVPSFQ